MTKCGIKRTPPLVHTRAQIETSDSHKELRSQSPLRMTAKLAMGLAALVLLLSGMFAAGEAAVKVTCGGKVGDCLWAEAGEEMGMDSETNRRVLWAAAAGAVAQKMYVSYEALKGDVVPCTRPGVPYYSCHVLPKANPYSRGCQIISGCRGGTP